MKELLVFLGTILILTSCGEPTPRVVLSPAPSCSVTAVASGSLIKCSDGSSVLVPNPVNVTTQFSIVGIVDPCGDAPGIHDEVFLRLADNSLLASFSDNMDGTNTRFVVIDPGSYQTTDGDNCSFTIDAGFNIINENHHY